MYETIGGSWIKCCWIKCHFCMSICFKLGTVGRYCVTKGRIRLSSLHFFWRASFLSSYFISERIAENRVSGYHLFIRCALNCEIIALNSVFEEFVRRSLSASPFMKPFLTPGGWQLEKCVYWNVSVGSKCVFMSNIDSLANRSPLKTLVSRNVSLSDISAVNLIVGWWLFACSMNCVTPFLFTFQIENISSIYLSQTSDLRALWLRICVSTSDIKMLAKATAILVPMAVPCIWR